MGRIFGKELLGLNWQMSCQWRMLLLVLLCSSCCCIGGDDIRRRRILPFWLVSAATRMKNLVEKFLHLALVIVGNYRVLLSIHANKRRILLVSRPFLASY
jgi:hypothetical protein